VQIGCMRFARVKCYDYPLTLGIDPDIAHTLNSLERRAQLSHAFITILAFGRNRDPLENGLIRTLQVVRIGRIEVMRIEWFNHRLSLLATVAPCRHRAQGAQFFAATVAPHLTAHHLSSPRRAANAVRLGPRDLSTALTSHKLE